MYNVNECINKRNEWFGRLTALFKGTYNENKLITIQGKLARAKEADLYKEPEKWVDECFADVRENLMQLSVDDDRFVTVSINPNIYGVHFMDKIFGAKVYLLGKRWNSEYISSAIGELEEPNLDTNETFQLAVRAAKRFAETNDGFTIFCLPCIASSLNIAVNLYGQEILIAMLEEPELARKDLETINRVLIKAHKAFREIIPAEQLQCISAPVRAQPPRYGQLCGCSTQLLGSELYAEFVSDLDSELLNTYENGGMIHLCGMHTQHIETFKNMTALKAVQLNDRAAADLRTYFENLRDDQIIYLEPCKEMSVEEALEITGGKRLVIMKYKPYI